jgi:predicted acetyltransferase
MQTTSLPGVTDSAVREPINPGELRDGDLRLELVEFGTHRAHKVPTYYFRMVHGETAEQIGLINLRVGFTLHVRLYAGHIGYGVHEQYRGQRYAARSVSLLVPLARRHGLDPIWITSDPENYASRRTLEIAGAKLIEIVNVPEDCVIRRNGHPYKCRYRLDQAR